MDGSVLKHSNYYKGSPNWSYIFVSGFLLIFFLFFQMFTGVAILFSENLNSFLFRYLHCLGASSMLVLTYIHYYKGSFYNVALGYKDSLVYITGAFSFLFLILVAFSGSVFSFGSISFWGSKVVTSFLDVFPIFGVRLKEALWGGPTMNFNLVYRRFALLHILFSLVFSVLIAVHVLIAHNKRSVKTPIISLELPVLTEYLYPGTIVKDIFVLVLILFLFINYLFNYDFYLDEVLNNIEVSSNKTPLEMRPAWYFWPSFTVLKFIEGRGFGILMCFITIFLVFIPIMSCKDFKMFHNNYF